MHRTIKQTSNIIQTTMATISAFEKYAYSIFADLYGQGWGETAAWNKAYEKASQRFNNTSNI